MEDIAMHRLVVVLALIASASATFFQDCGSLGSNVQLTVENCEVPPCMLQRGKTYKVNFKFVSSADSETLAIGASASIAGIEVPWPGLDRDACKQLEGTSNPCPIEKGSSVDWVFGAEVLREYPKITTVATFKLIDSNGGLQTCAKVPARIV